jgi:hypothetical protein
MNGYFFKSPVLQNCPTFSQNTRSTSLRPMQIWTEQLSPRPPDPYTIGKLRLSAFQRYIWVWGRVSWSFSELKHIEDVSCDKITIMPFKRQYRDKEIHLSHIKGIVVVRDRQQLCRLPGSPILQVRVIAVRRAIDHNHRDPAT